MAFQITESELLLLQDDNYTITNNYTDQMLDLEAISAESRIEAIIYGVLLTLASFGNLPVLYGLLRNRRRNYNIQKLLFHLAIADSIVAFVVIPLEISWRITVQWIAGDIACRIMLFLRAFGPYLSSMILVCISWDRYMAIVYPLQKKTMKRRVKMMIVGAWVFSAICSLPQLIIFHVESHPAQKDFKQCVSFNFFSARYQEVLYNIFCLSVVYVFPLVTIIFCYSRIMAKLLQRSRDTNS